MYECNFIQIETPGEKNIEPAGVQCLSLQDLKIYEQMKKPKGSEWKMVGFQTAITGQRIVDFLFKGNSADVDLTGSALEQSSVSSGGTGIIAKINMIR